MRIEVFFFSADVVCMFVVLFASEIFSHCHSVDSFTLLGGVSQYP